MRDRIRALARDWNVNRVIIEDTAGGMSLIPILKDETALNVIGFRPQGDKESRMRRHEALFETGRILLPKEETWSADFESELLGFPNARYDDQVDALLLFLDWFPRARWYEVPILIGLPYVGPPSGHIDYDPDPNGPILVY
jgi:predicted phage terminase large subunit-like protein